MKEIKDIKEEYGTVRLHIKNGKIQEFNAKTIYTFYTDGTNDCNITILNALQLSGNMEEK